MQQRELKKLGGSGEICGVSVRGEREACEG